LFGLGWNGATQLAGLTLQFVFSAILARLLSPSEFGLLAMVLVFAGFAASLADLGLVAPIIQKQTISNRYLDTAFWLIVAVGGFLTATFILLAPLVAKFFGDPQLRSLTIAMAFNFVLASLNVVQGALLDRSLDFRARFRIEITALAISGVTAVALTIGGAGVWSLVGQSLSLTLVRTVMMWQISPWRPAWSFDPAAGRELFRFGRHMIGFNAVIYWENNFDKLVIGRLLGSASLGTYGLAERVMRLPSTGVTGFAGSVMFPAFSALQNDLASVRAVYLRGNRMLALLTFPMMAGLIVVADHAVSVVFGDKWRHAVEIVQILCLAGMAQSVYNTAGWIYLALGRPNILLRLAILALVVRIVGVTIGSHWGLLGIAWVYVIGVYSCVLYPTWSAAGRLIGLPFGEILRNLVGPFCCAAGMAVVLWSVDRWLLNMLPHWQRLLILVIAGIALYRLLIGRFRLKAWYDVKEAILEFGGHRNRLVRWLLGSEFRAGSK
jgi:O-antigen/teichoic acid export membrane protein